MFLFFLESYNRCSATFGKNTLTPFCTMRNKTGRSEDDSHRFHRCRIGDRRIFHAMEENHMTGKCQMITTSPMPYYYYYHHHHHYYSYVVDWSSCCWWWWWWWWSSLWLWLLPILHIAKWEIHTLALTVIISCTPR